MEVKEYIIIRCTNKFPTFFIKNWAFIVKERNLIFIRSIVHRIVLLAFGTVFTDCVRFLLPPWIPPAHGFFLAPLPEVG